MTLSKAERQILVNQHKILALLDKNEASYHKRMAKAFERGFTYEYSSDSMLSDEVPEDQCKSVWKALSLYEALQDSWDRLADKDGIDNTAVSYRGFDGNNETELVAYSRYIVDDLERFGYLRISDHNSHVPMAAKYERMREKHKEFGWSSEMTAEQIREVLKAH